MQQRLLLLSLFLTAVSYVWIAGSLYSHELSSLMAAVFAAGCFEANESIAEDAIAEIAEKEKHGRWMGYLHVSSSGAFLVGPVMSGLLSQMALEAPFWGIFFCFAIAFVLSMFLPEFPLIRRPVEAFKALRAQFAIFSRTKFHFAFGVNALVYFAIFGFFRAYPMHLVEAFGLDISPLSLLIAWVAVPIVLSNLGFTHFLLKKYSPGSVLAFGSFGLGLFMLLSSLVPTLDAKVWAALFFTAACIGLCLPASPLFIARSAHRSILSEVLESDLGVLKGAETIASLSGGVLAAAFIQLPLFVFASLALLAAALLLLRLFADSTRD
jgi:predicted MFS family arabinose efflux permease